MSGLTTLRDDDGSATITTAGLIIALILVVLALTHGIRGTIASHHAKVVADLSAVAGAYAAYTGADPCDTAATDDVTVTVFDAPAHAVATAGPR